MSLYTGGVKSFLFTRAPLCAFKSSAVVNVGASSKPADDSSFRADGIRSPSAAVSTVCAGGGIPFEGLFVRARARMQGTPLSYACTTSIQP